MNKMRRKELVNLIKTIEKVQDKDDIYEVTSTLENIRDDEEEYYDNIPENLQSSQRAYDSEAAIDNMNDALDLLEEAYEAENDEGIHDTMIKVIGKINAARY